MNTTTTPFESALSAATYCHPTMWCHTTSLHRAINEYLLATGDNCLSSADIDREMNIRGYRVLFDASGRPCWRGVGLRADRSTEWRQTLCGEDDYQLVFAMFDNAAVYGSRPTPVQVAA